MSSIVYLDDEVALTKIFELYFEDSPHEIITFTSEIDAINYCEKHPPDILFIDYRLEKMKGDIVAERLPNSIYKILVTGDIKVDTKFNFDLILNKPFKWAEIANAVKDFNSGL
jgi:CheY-like chemotaxis protein